MIVWLVFLSGLFSLMLVICRVIGATKNTTQLTEEEKHTEQFLNAKEIFVRDPLDYKDVDNDGVDDIMEK